MWLAPSFTLKTKIAGASLNRHNWHCVPGTKKGSPDDQEGTLKRCGASHHPCVDAAFAQKESTSFYK